MADKLKSALGGGDDKHKKKGGHKDGHKDKDGGFLSIFKGDKKKEEEPEDKGGLFSFGKDKNKNDHDGKGGFFSKVFKKDEEDEGVQKKSGFAGLFSEQDGVFNTASEPCEDTGAEDLGTCILFYCILLYFNIVTNIQIHSEMTTDFTCTFNIIN